MNILHVKSIEVSKISAQPHPTLCIQFLNRENNDKVVSGDFCRFCSFYHRCYSVIRRCQTIQPLLPYSSAHSSACGQNILFLPSQEFFFLGTYQHPFTDFLPKDFRSRSDKRACIQPAATYLGYGLQNQMCGVIVISYNLIGGSSSIQCCHMIVNGPIEIIYQTESDERIRKWTWNTTNTNVWRGVSPVYFYISNSFSSYEVISDHQRTLAPDWHWREQIQNLQLQ